MPQEHDVLPRPSAETDAPTLLRDPARRWYVLVIVALAQLMVVLSVTIANIALPEAQADLGMTATDRQWVITGTAALLFRPHRRPAPSAR